MADTADMDEQVRVIIAARVSSEKQMTEGYGHAAQVARLPELVKAAGWVIARRPDGSPAIYDEGFASTTPRTPHELSLDHRPVMQALLAELADTRPTYLVCRELDRLYRDSYEHALVVKRLVAAGVKGIAEAPSLASLEIKQLDDHRHQAMASIEAAIGAMAKADLKVKLMSARRHRAHAHGLPNGGHAPYGYARGGKKQPLRINEPEAEVYRLMVEFVTEHGWGPAKIANELVKRGVATRAGTPTWTATTVRRILLSKAPAGFMRAKFGGEDRWIAAVGQPPLIPEDEWRQLQAVLGARSRESGTNQRRHALAGLLRCGACGKTLKAHPNKKTVRGERRTYINYSCKIYNSGCTSGYSISEPRALAELAGWVDARLAATEKWDDSIAAASPDLGLLEDRIASLSAELEKAQRRRDKSYAAFIEAEEADEAVARRDYETRRQLVAELEASLREAEERYGSAQTSRGAALTVSLDDLREILGEWQLFPNDEKRMALEVVIEKAILGPPGRKPRLTVVPAGVVLAGTPADA